MEFLLQEAVNMRNLLALVGLVVVGFAGAGWYLGWYKLGVDSRDPNHPTINVEVERDKIKQDLQKGAKSVSNAVQKEVQGQFTSQQVVPSELPPLPAPPLPVINLGDGVNPPPVPAPPTFPPKQ
jgi:hypothetical protein